MSDTITVCATIILLAGIVSLSYLFVWFVTESRKLRRYPEDVRVAVAKADLTVARYSLQEAILHHQTDQVLDARASGAALPKTALKALAMSLPPQQIRKEAAPFPQPQSRGICPHGYGDWMRCPVCRFASR